MSRWMLLPSLGLAFALTAPGQATINTVAGGGPNNLPAIASNLNNPSGVGVDASGNLYIAAPSQSRIFKVDTLGQLTVFAGNGTFGSSPDGVSAISAALGCPTGVAVDSSGNVFIADQCNSVVYRVSGGALTTFAGITGSFAFTGDGAATSVSLNGPVGVAADAAGNVFIADQDNNRVRRVTGGVMTTFAGDGTGGFNGNGPAAATSLHLNAPSGVAADPSGNVFIADQRNHLIRKVSGGMMTTFAGNGTPGFSGDGVATAVELNYPTGVAADKDGNILIADQDNNRIRKVTGGNLVTIAGSGAPNYTGDGGPATAATLAGPTGVAGDGSGNVFIADQNNNVIREVTGGNISTFAGNTTPGFSGDNGQATNASLFSPIGAAADSSGNLFISDRSNQRIRKVVPSGIITTFAGNGNFAFDDGGGVAVNASFKNPFGIAADGSGNLYIADEGNRLVRRVTPGGAISTVAGGGAPADGVGDGGPATSARLRCPEGVALDPSGNLYIADRCGSRVRKVSGGIISTVAGNGVSGNGADGLPATSASLGCPWGVAVDKDGNLLIADQCNHVIRKVTGGVIGTAAGNGSSSATGDGGSATAAGIGCPYSVAADAIGDFYIPDNCHNVVRKVTGGIISTVAGNGNMGFSGDGGVPTSASLACPIAVTVDAAGNLVIVDQCNQRVRRIGKQATTTTASSSGSPSAYGQSITFTAMVSPPAATGAVQFFDGANSLGTSTLIAGSASLATAALTPGSHSITAVYGGNGSFSGSTSAPVVQVVNKATPLFTNLSSPTITYGTPSTILAGAISAGAVVPSGNVSITLNGVPQSAAIQNDGSFSSSFATGSLPVPGSPYTIIYTYGGDANCNGANDSSKALIVNKAATSTAVASSQNPSVFGQSFTLTANVSSAAGAPPGNVQFFDGATSLGSAPLSAGSAALSLANLAGGSHSITAQYLGDTNFNGSTSAVLTQNVSPASTSTSVAPSASQSVTGQPVTFTATVTTTVPPAVGAPSGTVQFAVDGSNVGGPVTLTGGLAAFTTSSLAVGLHTVTATYSGDGNFSASTSSGVGHTVVKASTTTAVSSSANPSLFGNLVTFTANVSVVAPGVGPATGTVQFSVDGTPFGSPVNLTSGAASVSTAALAAGPHTITAAYDGGSSFLTSSGGLNQSVNPVATQAAVSTPSTSGPRQYSDLVTFTATLTPAMVNGVAPAQTVTFMVGTQAMGTVNLTPSGAALTGTLANVPLLEPVPFGAAPSGQMAPGTHTVTAVFGGTNANFTVNNPQASLAIAPEDARVNYTGALSVSTATSSSTTATVTLSTTVRDISAIPAGDTDPGDIRNTTVTFIDRRTNTPIATVPVGLVNSTDSKTGTATYNWTVNLGTSSSATYAVGMVVANYYTRSDPGDDVTVTVFQPGNSWATGSGALLLQNPAGQAAGAPNTQANFDFSVKFAGAGKPIQGNFSMTMQNGGRTYRITDSPLTSLAVLSNSSAATFNGVVSVQDITNPLSPVTLDSNATLQVDMTESALGISVWNESGGLWFSSNWNGVATVLQAPSSGKLMIHQ